MWRNPGFRRYWIALDISLLGDQVSAIAIPLVAVTLLHASASEMGVLTAIGQAPVLLFGLVAGAWADRISRRRLLIGCDVGRALVVAVIPLAAVTGFLGLPLLAGIGFVSAALGVLFAAAAAGFLPELVERDQLVDANGWLAQPAAVAQIAGPGLGGAVVQLLGAATAVVLDAVSYLVSAVLIGRIRVRSTAPFRSRAKVRTAVPQGLSHVWRSPVLRASAATAGTYNLFNSAVIAVLVLHLSRTVELSAFEVGLVLAATGPGALVGAALAAPASRLLGLGPTMIGGIVLAGASVLLVPLVGGLALLLTLRFLNGLGQPFYNVNQASLRQAIVPPSLQGRVQATLSVVAGAAAPIGAISGGLLGERFGTRVALLVAGSGTTLACGWLVCSPVRRLVGVPVRPENRSTESRRRA